MRLFKTFMLTILIFFGCFILYFNLVMALNDGTHPLITPFIGFVFTDDMQKWDNNYYFGFQSIIDIFTSESFPRGLTFSDIWLKTDHFISTLVPLRQVLQTFETGGADVFTILTLIFQLIMTPISLIVAFISLQLDLLLTIVEFVVFGIQVLTGYYNLNIHKYDSPLSTATSVITLSVSNGVVVW